MKKNIQIFAIMSMLTFIGTGLYTIFPSASYLLIGFACLVLFADKSFQTNPKAFVDMQMIKGTILFNAFLLIQVIVGRMELSAYVNQMISVNILIAVYVYTNLIFKFEDLRFGHAVLSFNFALLLSMTLLLLGQIAQITGRIQQVNFEGADREILIAVARPGGFLNPNVTASIAVSILYILKQLRKVGSDAFVVIAAPIACIIVLLTQSRAAAIALLILIVIIFSTSKRSYALGMLLFSIGMIYIGFEMFSDESSKLIDNALGRFEGDASSDDRQFLLSSALDGFANNPIFGNGHEYMVSNYGVASHNLLAEILVSYGLVGFILIGASIALLYLPSSPSLVIFCVVPLFLFSHNFFDSVPYQMMIGVAMAFDRIGIDRGNRKTQ